MHNVKKVNLEDISIFIKNGTTIKQDKNKQLGCPITRIETISKGTINLDKVGYANLNEDDYKDWLLQKGDILISHINSEKHLGKVAIFDSEVKLIHGMNLLNFRATDNIVPKYLYYFFNTPLYKRQIHKIMKKSVNQASFSLSGFRNIEIPLPPLPKQKAIAQKLDLAQKLIDLRKESIIKLDDLAKSVFVEMFGDPVENEMGWEVVKLKDVTTKIGSGSTPRGGKDAYKEEGLSLIRSLNIHDNTFKYKNLAFIDDAQADKLSNVVVEKDDVLLNITGASVCRCAIVPDDVLPARVNQHVAIIRTNETINAKFLLHLFISAEYKQKLMNIATSGGATREAITKENLELLSLIVPPITLQNKFAQTIQKIEAQKALYEAELLKLEEGFEGLLQESFD